MKPGTSALFVLDEEENEDMDVTLHAIRGLGGTVLKTNVDLELRKADPIDSRRPCDAVLRALRSHDEIVVFTDDLGRGLATLEGNRAQNECVRCRFARNPARFNVAFPGGRTSSQPT